MQIEVDYFDTKKKEIFKIAHTKCVIGRSSKADVYINRNELSRNHFEISLENNTFFITDLGSTNGIYLNGERLKANCKTSYSGIFPIEIGINVSIVISADEEAPATIKEREYRERARSITATTQTTTSQNSPIEKKVFKKKNNKKGFLQQRKPILGIALFTTAIAIYYYSTNTPENIPNSVKGPQTELELTKQLVQSLEDLNFKQYFQQGQCQDLGKLCADVGLTKEKETLVIADGKILAYVNLNEEPDQSFHSEFVKLNDKEKAEFFLGNIGINPTLVEKAAATGANQLLIIGFTSFEELVRMKYVLHIDFPQLPALTKDEHQSLFSEIFYAGIFRPYRVKFGKFAQLVDL
jgi:hypothetical protein